MNDEILELYKNTKTEVKIDEQELKDFINDVTRNNNLMQLEIYKELIRQYQETPINDERIISFRVTLIPNSFLADEKYQNILSVKSNADDYVLYTGSDEISHLVNINEVYKVFTDDGFEDTRIIYPSNNDSTTIFEITATIGEFKNIMDAKLKEKDEEKNQIL